MEKRKTFSEWMANKFKNAAKPLTMVNARKILGNGEFRLWLGALGAVFFGMLALPAAIIAQPLGTIAYAAIECSLILTAIHGWYLCEVDC